MTRRVRVGNHDAVFPPGYRAAPPLRPLLRLVFWPIAFSRPLRAFFYALPRSRLRTYLVALYFYRLVEAISDGDYRGFLPQIAKHAEISLFDLETYVGRHGTREALDQWREAVGAQLELNEFVNPPGREVFLSLRGTGRGASSGVVIDDRVYYVARIERGMAVRIAFYRDRTTAFEAVGLREPRREGHYEVAPRPGIRRD